MSSRSCQERTGHAACFFLTPPTRFPPSASRRHNPQRVRLLPHDIPFTGDASNADRLMPSNPAHRNIFESRSLATFMSVHVNHRHIRVLFHQRFALHAASIVRNTDISKRTQIDSHCLEKPWPTLSSTPNRLSPRLSSAHTILFTPAHVVALAPPSRHSSIRRGAAHAPPCYTMAASYPAHEASAT